MNTLLGVFSILPGIVDMSFSRKRLNMCATLTGERRETHVPQITRVARSHYAAGCREKPLHKYVLICILAGDNVVAPALKIYQPGRLPAICYYLPHESRQTTKH